MVFRKAVRMGDVSRMRGQSLLAAVLLGGSLLTGFAGTVILGRPSETARPAVAAYLLEGNREPVAGYRTPLSGGHTGTAFSVAAGTVVTNAHVVLRCREDRKPLQV